MPRVVFLRRGWPLFVNVLKSGAPPGMACMVKAESVRALKGAEKGEAGPPKALTADVP